MLEIIILILSVVVNSLLGMAVIIKNPKKQLNRLFSWLTMSLSAWLIINYFSLHPTVFGQLAWVRLVLAAASVLSYFVLVTFAIFPDGDLKHMKFVKPATYYLVFVVILTQTPLVFKTLNYDSSGNAQPIAAPGIVFFALLAMSFLGGAVFMLLRKYRHAQGETKDQLRIVISGIVVSFAAILITNFLLVSVFKNTSLISFAPLLTLILTGSMAYAILRHRLFDIRATVARSVAYLLLLAWVTLVYTAVLFGVIDVFFVGAKKEALRQFLSILLILPLLLTFPTIKRFFDQITKQVFYRDAYDTQLVLNELGDLLTAEINLHKILIGTNSILSTAIKPSFIEFVLFEEGNPRLELTSNKVFQIDVGSLSSQLTGHQRSLIVRDDLSANSQLQKLLSQDGIAVSLRLRTQHQVVGYMILGDKRSGSTYNGQDIKLLEIVANEVAVAIQNALRFEEIQKFNVTLQERVNEATKELRQANSRLRELDKTKDEFISMASHQLRTPLTTVKGYLSMILEGDVGPVKKEQKELMQNAFDGANRMVYLIADLLNVSRIQSGKFIIDDKPTDLAEVVAGEVLQLKEQAAGRQIELIYQRPEQFPVLNLDETKIRQVVMNFLDNAIYYTPKGGKVEVILAATDGTISYTVTDNGLGVPKDVQHHLFSKFYRAENARKMRPDGTGLGLFMAKKVVVAEGGAIIFKSSEGKGSTFGFSFPRKSREVKKDN